MPVTAPFADTKTDADGNAVPVSSSPAQEAPAPAPVSAPVAKIEKRGRKKKVEGRMFAIHSNEGCFICSEQELVNLLDGKTDPEIYLLDKKVKSLVVKPGQINLLTGEKAEDSFSIELE